MRKRCKGFNLIEAAVVLGVVGLVIGGIWSAHSSYKTTMIANRTFDGVTKMAQTLLPLYTVSVLGQGGSMNSFGVRQAYQNSAAALLDGKLDGFNGTVTNRYGHTALATPIGNATGNASSMMFWPSSSTYFGYEGLRIAILLEEVPKDICKRLTARVKGLMDSDARGNGLFKGIYFDSADYGGAYSYGGLYIHQQYCIPGNGAGCAYTYRYDSTVCSKDRTAMYFQINTPPQ